MFQISKQANITIVLCAMFCAGIACSSVSQSSSSSTSELRGELKATREIADIALRGNLMEFIAFEYHMIAGDIYRHRRDFSKAISQYSEAGHIADKSFAAKSFFTFLAFECKANAEQKANLKQNSYQDFKLALNALPDYDAYVQCKWTTQLWVIATSPNPLAEPVTFYLSHLALAEKLQNGFINHNDLITAIFETAKACDTQKAFDLSELYWRRLTEEIRAENYPPAKLEAFLVNYAYHEIGSRHYDQANETFNEAFKIATDSKDLKMALDVLLRQGEANFNLHRLDQAEEIFQKANQHARSANDRKSQSLALGYLSEIAHARNDLGKREDYLERSLRLTESSELKCKYLFLLALISAQRKETARVAEYTRLWKQSVNNSTSLAFYVENAQLKELIALHPRLKEFGEMPHGGCLLNPAEARR